MSKRALSMMASMLLLAGCASASPEPPGCPSADETRERVRLFLGLQLIPNSPATMTREAAACGAAKFTAALAATQGPVVGYKAGMTNPVAQQRFGLTSPIRGTLLRGMLLSDGAEVSARFGARPFLEPDLVVEVGSAAIHDAKTPEQVLPHLRAVIPFIELPDMLVVDPARINVPTLIVNNVGARLGVLGTPLPVRADAAFADALRDMTVRTVDSAGNELGTARGTAILGHPLYAVIWLAAELKKDGVTLRPGDLLSLGAFGASPAEAGKTVRVTYEGLPVQPQVSVRFK